MLLGTILCTHKDAIQTETLQLIEQNEMTACKLVGKSELDFPPSQTLRLKLFWLLAVTFFLMCHAQVVSLNLYKTFGETFIKNDYLLTALGATSAIVGSIGSFLLCSLAEYLSVRKILIVAERHQCGPLCHHTIQQQIPFGSLLYFDDMRLHNSG